MRWPTWSRVSPRCGGAGSSKGPGPAVFFPWGHGARVALRLPLGGEFHLMTVEQASMELFVAAQNVRTGRRYHTRVSATSLVTVLQQSAFWKFRPLGAAFSLRRQHLMRVLVGLCEFNEVLATTHRPPIEIEFGECACHVCSAHRLPRRSQAVARDRRETPLLTSDHLGNRPNRPL